MSKLKFTLDPKPMFEMPVALPVHGAGTVDVKFTFRHRTRDEMSAFMKSAPGRPDVDLIQDVATGWELDDPFDAKSIAKLVQNYAGAAAAIVSTYINEIGQARLGN